MRRVLYRLVPGCRGRIAVINRIQLVVLGFFGFAWASLVVILLLDPKIFDGAMNLPPGRHPLAELGFLGAISALIALLAVGVMRRWRWAFWLILAAFLVGGALRIPASFLGLTGVPSTAGPTWYLLLQALLGLVQVAIGILMLRGFRRAGPWGTF